MLINFCYNCLSINRADTPSGKYCNRTNKGRVSTVFNSDAIPHNNKLPVNSSSTHITLYDSNTSYMNVPRHMYMKTSEQAAGIYTCNNHMIVM